MTETHTPPIGTDANGDWTAVTYENSWVDYDGTRPVQYRLNGKGFVEMRGYCKNGTVNLDICTLPAGYRPEKGVHLYTISNNAYGQIRVFVTGEVRLQVGSNVWVGFNSITFKAGNAAPGIVHKPLIGEDGATSWTNMSYLNSWETYSGTYPPLRYMKDIDGIVHMEGLIKAGVIGAAAATLPADHRPVLREIYGVASNNLFGEARIHNDGTVMPRLGNNAFYSWSGISFSTRS